jgi:hypothetical protein
MRAATPASASRPVVEGIPDAAFAIAAKIVDGLNSP